MGLQQLDWLRMDLKLDHHEQQLPRLRPQPPLSIWDREVRVLIGRNVHHLVHRSLTGKETHPRHRGCVAA
jgi:hypothetical protein